MIQYNSGAQRFRRVRPPTRSPGVTTVAGSPQVASEGFAKPGGRNPLQATASPTASPSPGVANTAKKPTVPNAPQIAPRFNPATAAPKQTAFGAPRITESFPSPQNNYGNPGGPLMRSTSGMQAYGGGRANLTEPSPSGDVPPPSPQDVPNGYNPNLPTDTPTQSNPNGVQPPRPGSSGASPITNRPVIIPEYEGFLDTGSPEFEDNLRGSTFLPGDDERLRGAQGATDAAMSRVLSGPSYSTMAQQGADRYRSIFGTGRVNARNVDPNVDFEGVDTDLSQRDAINPEDTADLQRFRDMRMSAADELASGRSRGDIASDYLEAFDARNTPRVLDLQRKAIQNAARGGRLGMGDEGINALRPYTDYLSERAALEKELAAETAEGDIGDRYRRVDVSRGLVGDEEGIASGRRGESRLEREYATGVEDTNIGRRIGERDARMGLSERNVGRAFDDRDYQTGLDERNEGRSLDRLLAATDYGGRDADRDLADRYDQLDATGSLEDRIFGQGRANRDEFRTERGYQQGAGQQSIENRIREREMQNREMEQRIARAVALMQTGDMSLEEALAMVG